MTTANLTSPAVPTLDLQRAVNVLLEQMGCSITSVEIDLINETARVEIKCHDGRLLTLDARRGKATLTRERIESMAVTVGRRGDRAVVDRLSVRFLGRHVVGDGMRSGMRGLARYLDDNSTGPLLARDALRLLLS